MRLKKTNYVWKRCRRSLKAKRNPLKFEQEQAFQADLRQKEANNELVVYYFDASGFSTTPCVPYAWQKKSDTLKLPCQRSKQLNILGFMRRNNHSFFYPVEGRVNADTVIATFDDFVDCYAEIYEKTKCYCVVILDNAPVHTSYKLLKKRAAWFKQGVLLHFLPTYSPELNLIEILWRKIKYEWLPLDAAISYENLKKAVLSILDVFGKKYTIIFS